jgi:hypothetical protein
MHRRVAPLALSALTALGVTACSSSDAASPPAPATVSVVGAVPASDPTDPTTESTDTTAPGDTSESTRRDDVTTPSAPRGRAADSPIGHQVDGNRVLVLGDSVLASISSRYGDQLCTDLVPRRWAVEVDAEVGRRIEFGRQVLAKRAGAGWDAAVIMLGNNYDGDAQAYADELGRLLDELAPMPVVLLTVTRYRPLQDQVNYVIQGAAHDRGNVKVVDWQARTAEPDGDALLGGDGLHLSDKGRVALAAMVTTALGSAPVREAGECLPTTFTDDSMGTVTGGTAATTTGGTATTTTGGAGSGSRSRSGSGSSSGSGSRSGSGSSPSGSGRRSGSGSGGRAVTPTTHAQQPAAPVTAPPAGGADPPAGGADPPAGGGGAPGTTAAP